MGREWVIGCGSCWDQGWRVILGGAKKFALGGKNRNARRSFPTAWGSLSLDAEAFWGRRDGDARKRVPPEDEDKTKPPGSLRNPAVVIG